MKVKQDGDNIVDAHTGEVIVALYGRCEQGTQACTLRGRFMGNGRHKGKKVIVKIHFGLPHIVHEEAAILQELEKALCKCPEVIVIYDNCFVMEDMGEHDLLAYINAGVLSEHDKKEISEQLYHHCTHYHTAGITHNDIKPENIAVYRCQMTGKLTVCYVDAGSASKEPCKINVRTPVYASHLASLGRDLTIDELMQNDKHCLAMVLYVMVHKKYPSDGPYTVFTPDEKVKMLEHLKKIGAEELYKHFQERKPLSPLDHNEQVSNSARKKRKTESLTTC